MEYVVAKTNLVNPDINSPEWEKAQIGFVDKEPWTEGLSKSPQTMFKMLRGPRGISVLMHTNETHLRSEHNKQNEASWSAVETKKADFHLPDFFGKIVFQ